ncbi:MAG: hypothetical protein U0136_21970 [Bdellovibrionota bacterium]
MIDWISAFCFGAACFSFILFIAATYRGKLYVTGRPGGRYFTRQEDPKSFNAALIFLFGITCWWPVIGLQALRGAWFPWIPLSVNACGLGISVGVTIVAAMSAIAELTQLAFGMSPGRRR